MGRDFEWLDELVVCLHEPSVEMLVCFGEGELVEMHSVALCAPFLVIALVCEHYNCNEENEEMVVHILTVVVHFLWCHKECMLVEWHV